MGPIYGACSTKWYLFGPQGAGPRWLADRGPTGGSLNRSAASRNELEYLLKVEVDTRYTLFILNLLAFLPIGVNILGEHCLENQTKWVSTPLSMGRNRQGACAHE